MIEPVSRAGRSAARKVLDFALPPRCPACGAVTADPHLFCVDCWRALSFLGEPCCERCGLPFASPQGPACGRCMAEPPAYDRARAAVGYGEVARKVVLKLKYGGRPGVAETLARLMQRHLVGEADDALLVPVPLHRWRLWARGYNQAALIADALARRTGRTTDMEILLRTKRTPALRGLGRRERALAVRGAFRVADAGKAQLAGRTVILVDDVHTSGATADACARTLKRAGAERVNLLCWARVVGPSED